MTNAVPGESQTPAVTPPQGGEPASAAGENPNANGAPGSGESDQDRNWKNLRGDRDYWRDRATQLEQAGTTGQPRQQQTPPAPAKDETPPKKTLADFGYDERAYDDYVRETARAEARKAARDEIEADNRKRADEARRTSYETKAADFAKANPTYYESVQNPRFVQSDALIAEIMEAENGPAIALYLSNNLNETNRLNGMSATQVAREVTKLSHKLSTASAAAAVPRNQVPGGGEPPPNPPAQLGATGDPGIKKDPAKMTDAEWWASRNKGKKK